MRRVFQLLATADMVGQQFSQIAFYATDNSGVLDSQRQLPGTKLCCASSNLLSLLNVSFTVRVNGSAPAFLDPTPPQDFK